MTTTRREFLCNGLRVTALIPAVSGLLRVARREGPEDERVLVVVQLTGGNDGLNTVVPHRQDAYYRARPSLALPREELHGLDDDCGLHPAMRDLGELFQEGRLACVQRVGYPEPSRSHFRALEIWHTADPVGPAGDVGWLGRIAERVALASDSGMAALFVGDGSLPLALHSRERLAPTIPDAASFRLARTSDSFEAGRAALLDADRASGELAFLRAAARASYDAAASMQDLTKRASQVDYPDSPLARRLRLVAQLIAGDFGPRVFYLEHRGFDTHARQRAVHENLLGELARALGAFQRDLEATGQADRVVLLAFSEFGRRVAENASRGTDHGAAAPVFLLGQPVRGGLLGAPPDLERLVEGDVSHAVDFRSIYATLERDWMGCPPSSDHPSLPLLA